jgi:hypothetical protein
MSWQPPFQPMNVSCLHEVFSPNLTPNTRFLPSKDSWASWRPNSSRCNLHKYIRYCFSTKIFLDRPGMLYRPTTGNSRSKLECPSVERNYLGEWNAKAVRYNFLSSKKLWFTQFYSKIDEMESRPGFAYIPQHRKPWMHNLDLVPSWISSDMPSSFQKLSMSSLAVLSTSLTASESLLSHEVCLGATSEFL